MLLAPSVGHLESALFCYLLPSNAYIAVLFFTGVCQEAIGPSEAACILL